MYIQVIETAHPRAQREGMHQMNNVSAMGCHRALSATDLRQAAAIRLSAARAALSQNKTYQADKDFARQMVEGLRDVRLAVGADGYKLP